MDIYVCRVMWMCVCKYLFIGKCFIKHIINDNLKGFLDQKIENLIVVWYRWNTLIYFFYVDDIIYIYI